MKINKIISLSAISLICFSVSGCGNTIESEEVITLNVYNCADYIAETEEDALGVCDQFEIYCKEVLGKTVEVAYSTYETNEDMFNQLKAGGVQYDLVCPSEYMIDKLIQNDMLEKMTSNIENYEQFGSSYIKSVFDGLSTKNKVTNEMVTFDEYAIPYMWGTMGFMYDPANVSFEDVSTWDIIWNEKFKNQTSLKDSLRDTYITATFHIYKDELELAKQTLTGEEYNAKVTEVMNRCDDQTLQYVELALKQAKDNIYEFEVDTGKENIIKGKYYVNLCWSGDAVYALDLAEDEEDFILNYVIPSEGSNVWFDGWCMPKGANVELAQEFMNFLCDPSIAVQNMEYVGYTSAIAGQELWDLVVDWYEAEESEETTDYDLTYFFKNTGIVDEDGNEMTEFVIHTSEINRQLYAQYPDKETINRCAVMKDFGDQQDAVSSMWIRVQGNKVSWGMYAFLIAIVLVVAAAYINKYASKRVRRIRQRARKVK